MKNVTVLFLISTLFLLFFAVPVSYANRDEGMHPANGFFLPEGDAVAGKAAFSQLKCDTCHWVQNDMDLSTPVADKPGPMLGAKQSQYSRGWIANSIVSPSHTVVWNMNGYADDSDLSRMGDFTEVMTVRQLIDLIEFIKSLGNEKA